MSDTTLHVLIYAVPLTVYFIPAFIAMARGHRQKGAIFALNLLLGWTLFGWVAAFVWAFVNAKPPLAQPTFYREVAPGQFVPVHEITTDTARS